VCEAARRLEQIADGGDLAPAEQHLRALEQCLESLCDAIGGFLQSAEDSLSP
jgi:hypothetical protein